MAPPDLAREEAPRLAVALLEGEAREVWEGPPAEGEGQKASRLLAEPLRRALTSEPELRRRLWRWGPDLPRSGPPYPTAEPSPACPSLRDCAGPHASHQDLVPMNAKSHLFQQISAGDSEPWGPQEVPLSLVLASSAHGPVPGRPVP